MGAMRPWHVAILVAVLVLLFGARRLPDAARSIGRSLRIIKAETRDLVGDPEPDDDDFAGRADPPYTRRTVHAETHHDPVPPANSH